MWIIKAIVIHVLLLGSIFVTYFRSPVITGLEPQKSFLDAGFEPPAKRLVLIVTDGLRAQSFFENNCENVPRLQEIFTKQGLVGISRTHVPTESRPGHIALIAGLYEDPSAVTRGWKANPIEFDTIFNRSGHTYAWGADDVLHIFSKLTDGDRPMYFDAYDHELDFSGHHKTYKLDEWVFQRVKQLLNRKGEELRSVRQVVFFLHLLGLDTAGHVHKPGSELFLENLRYTQGGIADIYERFEQSFPDRRTAYLLTSDHGMTNAGSHGAGDPYETETPFFVWGAGVKSKSSVPKRTFKAGTLHELPLHDLEQAQLTPLMAALIGLPPPTNNFGVLPIGYLNTSESYEAFAAHKNAMQLLAQYKRLQQEHESGYFTQFMNAFEGLSHESEGDYLAHIKKYQHDGLYAEATTASLAAARAAIRGIGYYHSYYMNALLFCTTLVFVGWLLYLSELLKRSRAHILAKPKKYSNSFKLPMYLIFAIVLVFVIGQRIPVTIGFYMLLPICVWYETLRQHYKHRQAVATTLPKLQLLFLVACAELLVFTFFERRLISLAYLLFAIVNHWHILRFGCMTRTTYFWICIVLLTASFPLLPASIGYQNLPLLIAGISLNIMYHLLSKEFLHWRSVTTNILGILNGLVCILLHSVQYAVPLALRLCSCCFLVYAIASILTSRTVNTRARLSLILRNLTSLYALFCTSYELLFVQLMVLELSLSVELQTSQLQSSYAMKTNFLQQLFAVAFRIILYTFLSFFGTGNIASVSSFDPNIVRCFLTTFSPFTIMSLVILKLVIPVILVISIIFATSGHLRKNEREIFICVLFICDVMGLNFLYLVRNQGSWLEIGSSISHFVIMEVTTLGLLVLTLLAKLLLGLPVSLKSSHD